MPRPTLVLRNTAATRAYLAEAEARKRHLQACSDARRAGRPAPEPDPVLTRCRDDLSKAVARSAKSKLARDNGERFEGDCLKGCTLHGIELFKIPSGCKWLNGGHAIPQKTPFDFAGAVPILGGRGIFFDAKHLSRETHVGALTIGSNLIKPHQVTALRLMGKGLAISGLVLECGAVGEIRWLDWRFLRMGDEINWDSPKWFTLSPIGDPIDFGHLVAAYRGAAHGV